jgi:hypothetical protein
MPSLPLRPPSSLPSEGLGILSTQTHHTTPMPIRRPLSTLSPRRYKPCLRNPCRQPPLAQRMLPPPAGQSAVPSPLLAPYAPCQPHRLLLKTETTMAKSVPQRANPGLPTSKAIPAKTEPPFTVTIVAGERKRDFGGHIADFVVSRSGLLTRRTDARLRLGFGGHASARTTRGDQGRRLNVTWSRRH